MHTCSADQRTTCYTHSLHHPPDTPAPETDFGGASRQRGASIRVPESDQLCERMNGLGHSRLSDVELHFAGLGMVVNR